MPQGPITVDDIINELTDFAETINKDISMTEVRRKSVRKDLAAHIKTLRAAYAIPDIRLAAGFFHGSATGLNEIPFETVFPGEVA